MTLLPKVKWDANASIYCREPDGTGVETASASWQGPLHKAVKRVMAMPAEKRERTSIGVTEGAVPGTSLLFPKVIAELHGRPDFPRA